MFFSKMYLKYILLKLLSNFYTVFLFLIWITLVLNFFLKLKKYFKCVISNTRDIWNIPKGFKKSLFQKVYT